MLDFFNLYVSFMESKHLKFVFYDFQVQNVFLGGIVVNSNHNIHFDSYIIIKRR